MNGLVYMDVFLFVYVHLGEVFVYVYVCFFVYVDGEGIGYVDMWVFCLCGWGRGLYVWNCLGFLYISEGTVDMWGFCICGFFWCPFCASQAIANDSFLHCDWCITFFPTC